MSWFPLCILLGFLLRGANAEDELTRQLAHDLGNPLTFKFAEWEQRVGAEQLQKMMQSIMPPRTYCHLSYHGLGSSLLTNNTDWKEAMDKCTNLCNWGCQHGVLDALIWNVTKTTAGKQQHQVDALASTVRMVCQAGRHFRSQMELFQCFHGAAHPLFDSTNDNTAIAACHALSADGMALDSCLSGVFMTMLFPPNPWLHQFHPPSVSVSPLYHPDPIEMIKRAHSICQKYNNRPDMRQCFWIAVAAIDMHIPRHHKNSFFPHEDHFGWKWFGSCRKSKHQPECLFGAGALLYSTSLRLEIARKTEMELNSRIASVFSLGRIFQMCDLHIEASVDAAIQLASVSLSEDQLHCLFGFYFSTWSTTGTVGVMTDQQHDIKTRATLRDVLAPVMKQKGIPFPLDIAPGMPILPVASPPRINNS